MSTTERKARKRANVPFTKTPKVLTPPEERAQKEVFDRNGKTRGAERVHVSKRALRRVEAQNEFRSA